MSFTVKILGERVGKADTYVFTERNVKWGRIIEYINFPPNTPDIALLKPKLELSKIVLGHCRGERRWSKNFCPSPSRSS